MDGTRVALRDRLKHASPNAAHAESFAAGALHVRLGGPVSYDGVLREKAWLGKEYGDPEVETIEKAQRLIMASSWVAVSLSCAGLLLC